MLRWLMDHCVPDRALQLQFDEGATDATFPVGGAAEPQRELGSVGVSPSAVPSVGTTS